MRNDIIHSLSSDGASGVVVHARGTLLPHSPVTVFGSLRGSNAAVPIARGNRLMLAMCAVELSDAWLDSHAKRGTRCASTEAMRHAESTQDGLALSHLQWLRSLCVAHRRMSALQVQLQSPLSLHH